jgi:ribose transport system permease protein
MRTRSDMVRRLLDFAPLILLLALVIVFGLIDSRVVAADNLKNVLLQATPIAVLGLGAFVVLLSGGIDLSAGFAAALLSVVFAKRLTAGDPLVLALLVTLGVALVLGLVNGLLVGLAKLPPFVATLATMVMVQGATLKVASSGVLIVDNATLRSLGTGSILGVPALIVATALVGLLAWVVMRGTRFGLRTYAVGSDEEAAKLSGVGLQRQQVLIYLTSSVMVLVTAVALVSRTPVVSANVGGTSLLLDGIAAAVIGGTSIFGGRGTVAGVLVGAVIIALITNALRVFGVDPSSIDLLKGTIIVLALLADTGIRTFRARAARPAL